MKVTVLRYSGKAQPFSNYVEKRFSKGKKGSKIYYNDIKGIAKNKNKNFILLLLKFDGKEIQEAYYCNAIVVSNNNLLMTLKNKYKESLLELEKLLTKQNYNLDYEKGHYFDEITFDNESEFMSFFGDTYSYKFDRNEIIYKEFGMEKGLSPIAQKNQFAWRYYNSRAASSSRPEFLRDKDRIIHSKAYRRLVDKAQIFTSKKGDHYRTRMTHTQEVAQIAIDIGVQLNLNSTL